MANYSIHEHKHRYAAWAASRAASVINYRFKVHTGIILIEAAGLKEISKSTDKLPNPNNFDAKHAEWRDDIIDIALNDFKLTLSHGVAAKLINMYFKEMFICGGMHEHDKVAAIHPPIDRILLKELNANKETKSGKIWMQKPWSKFSSTEYQSRIDAIKILVGTDGLWSIEKYWNPALKK